MQSKDVFNGDSGVGTRFQVNVWKIEDVIHFKEGEENG